MLHTDKFPVLEFDDDPHDLIGQGEAKTVEADRFPSRAVFAFLGPAIDEYAADNKLAEIDRIEMIGDVYPVYRAKVPTGDVALMRMPLGSPAAVMCTDYLFRFGVKRALAVGSCGALEALAEGELFVPTRALRDEGTSYHYLPASPWVDLDPTMRGHIEAAVARAGYHTSSAPVWTNDAFYRETPEMLAHRLAQGCRIVDMECSAMAASAQLRGADFAQLFYTADSLGSPEGHEARDWGYSERDRALQLALNAISRAQA
ncbi:nucleoside phosphorylase [Propionibacterium freudenreichii]|uniref:nucleoside phosphorylase n=1 Tax=Propionibacterium freudenreichii TaxID=1744 RepID=UPI000BC35A19|nr:nucleoside phosphorylase [Propionibacterium freudenreichii]MDK9593565.1 nucleoside phosphorylase [Propionibacterium freudenreichii]WFF34440.1 nucleoside phosphorylase [Propionibacterium freudenreichii]WFF36669.1 nucleoside phosphorylase [Propionibacterium freudenreichii]SBN51052.1 Phosphorylase family protein [Propionibacterium freudenreichii]